ncbi:MAG: hypothetical protein Q9174_000597 [Haloplaca sp. 1 TL-2023]
MLTESFVASTLSLEKKAQAITTKDVGIHFHEYQPIPSLKTSFRKSSTNGNCLAISATHVFAAQADKSVVHVYSTERWNQEAVVPFQEKITCLALAGPYDGAGTLALGTEGGRLILWELATGRQIITPQSHLQKITCLALDPTFNFLLSGSSDSNIHVWSLQSLLSFSQPSDNHAGQSRQYSPLRTLTNHRAPITALISGHSGSKANFVISASKDQTCIIWDYFTGTLIRTYLLSSTPLCLALDPADRAAYAGYEDGSVQILDFYKQDHLTHTYHHPVHETPSPIQPPTLDRWCLPDSLSSVAQSVALSYDGSTLLSGHKDGHVHTWNIAAGKYASTLATDFSLPVTNLIFLPPTGFPDQKPPNVKLVNVVKPRFYEGSTSLGNNDGNVPLTYTHTMQFIRPLLVLDDAPSSLDGALIHPSFPGSLLDEGVAELSANHQVHPSASSNQEFETLRSQNESLKKQLDVALKRQREATAEVLAFEEERVRREEDERIKRARKKKRRIKRMEREEVRRKIVMGEIPDGSPGEEDEDNGEGKRDLSSDTDEVSSSD